MLDRSSPVPMYHQVKNEIISMIHQGTFAVGEKVYSENELCRQYDVSPITAKRVLNELAKEGYITRHPGKGSFVKRKEPISHILSNFYSFTDEVRHRGMTPSNKLIRLEVVTPPRECAIFFKLAAGQRVLLVQRQRFADSELIALDHSFLPEKYAEKMTKQAFASSSLYEILREHGVAPDKAVESFGAASLSAGEAKLLEMETGAAVLQVSRHTLSAGEPMEYNFRYYKPNTYIYQIELNLGK